MQLLHYGYCFNKRNSLLPHLDEIQLLAREKGIHFLSLNETKIDMG